MAFMPRPLPIGLDIGRHTVRMLQLSGSGRDLRVVDAAKFTIPEEAKADALRRRPVIVENVRRLVRERHFRRREVVAALADDQIGVRNVRMPRMADEELGTAVNWEAQNKFPFDTTTAVIQHVRAGEVRQADQVFDEIILFAAPRDEIERITQIIAEAGLELVSLDAKPCAVFRGFERFLLRRDDANVVSVFVDLGARTTVLITRGREIVFVKTVPIGGELFNRSVAECLELAPAESEALRRRIGRRTEAEGEGNEAPGRVRRAVEDAIRPHVEDLANEIGLCLRYYAVTFHKSRPETVVFTGGEAHNAGLPEALAARLGVEATIADPLRGVRTDHLGPVLDRRGCLSEWTTAFGLSLKGMILAEQLRAG